MSLTIKQSEALQMQDAGLTYKQIADVLGISEQAVQVRLARARHHLGIPQLRLRRPATEPTERQEQVLALKSEGLQTKQIAERLGINSVTVKRHVSNARIRAEKYTRHIRITREFEVTSEEPLIDLEIREIFSTASDKRIDAHLLKSDFEWIDQPEQEQV